jgi:2-polyprenyl-3-methyl-5-hydroxy-6-metoxy-1,4-benzoquinol methylase
MEDPMTVTFSLIEKRGTQKLSYAQLSKKNLSASNLTELNATDAVNNGFMSHNDWVAHVTRYGFIQKKIGQFKPKRVLEVGSGRFPLVNYLWRNRDQAAFEYTAIDLRARHQWFEHLGWKKGNVNLLQADLVLDDIDLGKPFDLVVCTEVFEHVPRKLAPMFMKRLADWTAAGGHCIFSTPNAGVSKSTAENHIGEDGKSREWTYKDKMKIAGDAGFKVLDTYGTFIAKSRIPEEFWTDDHLKAAEFLPHAMFTVYAAAAYPARSNNALFLLTK